MPSLLAIWVMPLPVLVTAEDQIDGVGLGDQPADEIGLGVGINAGVAGQDDEVGLLSHFLLIVLVGLNDVGEIDALPVGGDVPLGDIGVANAHHSHGDAIVVIELIGGIAVPGAPVGGFATLLGGIQVVGAATATEDSVSVPSLVR